MAKRTNKAAKTEIVAEICLYGNRQTGAGWLAQLADGSMLGNGEPNAMRGFTDAILLAREAIIDRVGNAGSVWVYEPRGQKRAKFELPYPRMFGDLEWESAPQLEISLESIIAESDRQEAERAALTTAK